MPYGAQFLLNHAPYRVAGVVKDVSTLADCAYGQVWVPYTSTGMDNEAERPAHGNDELVLMLARSRDDFPLSARKRNAVNRKYNTLIGRTAGTDLPQTIDQEKRRHSFRRQYRTGCECSAPSADYHLRHSADSACHQSFEHDTEPFASAGIGNRSAPCFRQYTRWS